VPLPLSVKRSTDRCFCTLVVIHSFLLQEIDVKAGGGCVITIGEMCREFLVKLDWYSALFPRIPVPIQKDLDVKLRSLPPPPRAAGATDGVTGGDEEEEAQNGGNGAWSNRERAEGGDRSVTDDDGRDNGHRKPIPAVRSPPRSVWQVCDWFFRCRSMLFSGMACHLCHRLP